MIPLSETSASGKPSAILKLRVMAGAFRRFDRKADNFVFHHRIGARWFWEKGANEAPPHDAMRRCDPDQRIEERKEVLPGGKRREAVAIIPSGHKN